MRGSGQVTIFLSLILISICSLTAALFQSARFAGARCYLQSVSDSALDSVFSQYHRELWDKYHLLALEFGSESDLETDFRRYLEAYFEGGNFYPMGFQSGRVEDMVRMTDQEGAALEEEILDYMKYGIWSMELNPAQIQDTIQSLVGAGNVREIARSYEKQSEMAMKMERTLEDVERAVGEYEELYGRAKAALCDYRGSEFRSLAAKAIRQLKKLPGLVDTYERQADALREENAKDKEGYLSRRDQLDHNTAEAMDQELSHYEAYVEKDGARRQEILSLRETAQHNQSVVEEAVDQALEVEEYLDSWEGDDEEEEPDEGELWDPVIAHYESCQRFSLSFTHSAPDEEKRSLLEGISKLAGSSLLDLVVPEGTTVSEAKIATTFLPSAELGASTSGKLAGKLTDADFFTHPAEELVHMVTSNEYGIYHFNNFLSEEKRPQQYQIEYVLGGAALDRENLEETVGQLLLIREGMNFTHILTDPQKKEEARLLAATIVGGSGLLPLVEITAFFIMGVWALAEAILDIRQLLDGGQVPLLKSSADWHLTLEGLLQIAKDGFHMEMDKSANGLDYQGYIRILLLLMDKKVKYYRYMDVIQSDIIQGQPDFLMKTCAFQIQTSCSVAGRFRLSVQSQKSY